MYIHSVYYRKKAVDALKGHWQPALLVALIVNLPTLLMQGFSTVTGNDLLSRLESYMVTTSRDGVISQDAMLGEMNAILSSTSFWSIRVLELVAMLVTPCLMLGMYKWLMDLVRGQEQPVSAVFCRTRLFFKAIGLQLLVILKVLLWMLPGLAVMIIMMVPLVQSGLSGDLSSVSEWASMLFVIPVTLMAVPGVIAALRYAMAEYILAEKPDSTIRFCVSHSKELMKDSKWDLLRLMLSFILWYLLEILVASLLSGVLSLVFQMVAGMALDIYMAASICLFYLQLEREAEKRENPQPEPAPDPAPDVAD